MMTYVVRRVATTAAALLLILTFLGVAVHVVPGDPAHAMLGPRASPSLVASVRAEMGLDKSVPEQVWSFIAGAVQGDLGSDFISHLPVTTLIGQTIGNTVALALASLVLSLGLALPLAMYSASHPNSLLDRGITSLSLGILTIPPYVAGMVLLIVFAVQLPVLPSLGAGSFADLGDYAQRLILPSLALAISWVGYFTRLLRASLLDVLENEYIRTARAYGMRPSTVLIKYALKNAVAPTVAIAGIAFGDLIGNAVFVEIIFGRDGLGSLAYDAITARNYTIVRGVVLTFAMLFIVANLAADLLNRALDPRQRTQEVS